ncbi:MAG TPA: SDR family oxidoreductase [Candidatus Elarobacter sp.]|nr:SDR family oxidoreductase [Candidatus Elarobacter sp.]
MDLGINGKRAIVSAASKGLGRGCATALAREGVLVTIAARTREALEATAREIEQETGTSVTAVVADVTTAEGRAAVLAACADPDILVNNAGGEPPGDFRDWAREDWLRALDANMLGPIELIKATIDGMIARRFGRIVNITSSAVKAPIPLLGLSNGSRGGLTGFVAGLARDVAATGVTINNILPGAFDTDRLRTVLTNAGKRAGRTFEEQLAIRVQTIPERRLGTPAEFGALCAFVCSTHAAYITGQNFLIDGGAYPGTY